MRTTGDIRMDGNGKYELVILSIEVVEVVPPEILNVASVDESMAVRRRLDEHHGGKIIDIPVRRNLNESCFLARYKRFHPLLGLLRVVDLRPGVARPQIVRLTICVAHAVVVLDAIRKEELGALFAGLPPGDV